MKNKIYTPFIKITEGGFSIDDSVLKERSLIETFEPLLSKKGIDKLNITCGVNPSPDFGYFELGDRFWRASLCIYLVGITRGFIERGVGYSEPWLFNARHAIELYIKGQLLYSFWFEDLQKDNLSSGHVTKIQDLRKKLRKQHDIYALYKEYEKRTEDIISKWDSEKLREPPDITSILLSQECGELLKELDESDKSSFRFRYPSFRKEDVDHLHKLNWKYDERELFLKTSLPKTSGYFFDHIKVINGLHLLMEGLQSIESYLGACWDYIGEMQDWALEMMSEFSDYSY